MRAIVVREPGDTSVMKLEHVPDPVPKGNQVLIRVRASAVCFHDVVVRNGTLRRGIQMPLIPGHEIAGVVADVGDSVRTFSIGEHVVSTIRSHICGQCNLCRQGKEMICPEMTLLGDVGLNGGYAEYALVEADNVIKIPPGVSMEQAAVAPCAIGTVWNAVIDIGQVRPGDFVLVTGAGGGVGIHAVQIAKRSGGFVIAATSSSNKVEEIQRAGADVVVLVHKGEDFSKKILQITEGHGVDVAIDNVGTPLFSYILRSMALAGRYVLVGQVSGDFIQFNPAQLFLRGVNLLSAVNASRNQVEKSLTWIQRGWLTPYIYGVYPLDDAPRIHEMMERGNVMGRAILIP